MDGGGENFLKKVFSPVPPLSKTLEDFSAELATACIDGEINLFFKFFGGERERNLLFTKGSSRKKNMKILLISDLHANIDALNAVWARENDADVVLCAGDIVDWGWNPHEVIAWLKEKNAICICGNHDLETLKLYDSGVREELGKETTYASHCVNQLTDEDVAFLRALPETRVLDFDGVR